ncbi:serine hydrolase domain-containing protein [Gephyromycinifex aptenodytis]|uniref:serine hydrolase domain-containing protein n=1 Tax=Gephyromycinifex aptenodytis TaxID=2716227 RepID=UPI001445EE80|nr:serine hydrolase domain-containing protein [Gephyromycinifex aptenodytis]
MPASPITESGHSSVPTRPPLTRSRRAALLVAASVIGALLALVLGPNPQLGDTHTGDPTLVADTKAILGPGRGIPALSVARIEDGTTTFAGFGEVEGSAPTPDTPFELGSITKTFTGQLLAVAVERGEMRLDDPLSTHLPELAGTPAGAATLRELATHTSGLPRMPKQGLSRLTTPMTGDPYGRWSRQQVIDAARTAQIENKGTRAYSNFGMALLGHAQARAAGVSSWTELATARLLRPLNMTHTVFITGAKAGSAAELPGMASPHWANGRSVAPWSGEGFAPAGAATRTTAKDLARYTAAVLDGSAPGVAALTPVTDGEPRRSGLAWIIDTTPEGQLTWHNGGTGGSSTMLAMDVSGRKAALALASSDRSVDELGIGLLRHDATPLSNAPSRMGLIAVGIGLCALVSLLVRLTRRPTRLTLATGVVEGLSGLVVAWLLGPWGSLPGWVLGALAGAILGGVALAALTARHSPATPATGKASAIISLVFSVVLLAGVLFLLR